MHVYGYKKNLATDVINVMKRNENRPSRIGTNTTGFFFSKKKSMRGYQVPISPLDEGSYDKRSNLPNWSTSVKDGHQHSMCFILSFDYKLYQKNVIYR